MRETRHRAATSLGPVAYRTAGRGPALVLLHGNPGDARDWDAVVGRLAERYTVIRPDWPGYGGSTGPAGAPAVDAPGCGRVLSELLDALCLERVMLIGHSVGGYAALREALARPHRVAAMVLVAPAGFTRFTPLSRAVVRLMGTRAGVRLAGPLAAMYALRRTPASRAVRRRAARLVGPHRSAVHGAMWRSFLDPACDLRLDAPHCAVPTLLTWGRADPVVPWHGDGRRAARLLPRARAVLFWAGHLPHAEVPDRWLAAVLPFLDDGGTGCGGAHGETR